MKIAVSELEQMLTLLKKTSTDMHLSVRTASSDSVMFSYTTVDGEHVQVELWNESTRNFAKVTSSERLGTVLGRYKK